jgi:hypothetical protein
LTGTSDMPTMAAEDLPMDDRATPGGRPDDAELAAAQRLLTWAIAGSIPLMFVGGLIGAGLALASLEASRGADPWAAIVVVGDCVGIAFALCGVVVLALATRIERAVAVVEAGGAIPAIVRLVASESSSTGPDHVTLRPRRLGWFLLLFGLALGLVPLAVMVLGGG